jgi:hypothetical protein
VFPELAQDQLEQLAVALGPFADFGGQVVGCLNRRPYRHCLSLSYDGDDPPVSDFGILGATDRAALDSVLYAYA